MPKAPRTRTTNGARRSRRLQGRLHEDEAHKASEDSTTCTSADNYANDIPMRRPNSNESERRNTFGADVIMDSEPVLEQQQIEFECSSQTPEEITPVNQDQIQNTTGEVEGADPGCLDAPYSEDCSAGQGFEDSLEAIIAETHLEDLRMAFQFVEAIREASLDDSYNIMSPASIERLRNPPTESFDSHNYPDLCLGLRTLLVSLKSSVDVYNTMREAILLRHPDDNMPSYDRIKRIMAEITGVTSISHPMCKNSCAAFTGPFTDLDNCPICGESKICPTTKKPHQEFHTILLGPVLQALRRESSSAQKFQYRMNITRAIIEELEQNNGNLNSYEDFFYGSDYLEKVRSGEIGNDDIVLMLSIDGAQLYAHKASDCWIYIWVIMDISPDERYKKKYVLPGGFIPGPNKPKNLDSFLFPGLHHVSALQKEGLRIWDASMLRLLISKLFIGLNTADGPGMAYLNGLVGHHGKYGCRLYCPVPGRHKQNGSHYYPALLKPDGYIMNGCDHPDIPHHLVANSRCLAAPRYLQSLRFLSQSPNETQYKKRRLETGISKPTIFLGFASDAILGIPGCFGSDIMHLASFNLADLLVSLWRGQLDHEDTDPIASWPWAVLKGDTWEQHGKSVAAATPYLPGSFDRPPRNIAEKINSGYKAWEWLLYLYGLAPALLYGILPQPYYSHFCKLVAGIQVIQQHKIAVPDLIYAEDCLQSFVDDFETLYYQRRADRLHFCRQSIHALLHLATEVTRLGPPICSSQWTMERTIGNLGEEIRQPSNPYANLSQRGLFRCQVNALKAMIPDLQPEPTQFPRGSVDVGLGYVLLRAQDRYNRAMRPCEALALAVFLQEFNGTKLHNCPKIARWARLRLPNGQVSRSRWKEILKPLNKIRIARNIKFQHHGATLFGEVYFYFRCRTNGRDLVLAVVSVYQGPHRELLEISHGTFAVFQYVGDTSVIVINVCYIQSVVAMVPIHWTEFFPLNHNSEDMYFLVERPGLDTARLGGAENNF